MTDHDALQNDKRHWKPTHLMKAEPGCPSFLSPHHLISLFLTWLKHSTFQIVAVKPLVEYVRQRATLHYTLQLCSTFGWLSLPLGRERVAKYTGVVVCQDAKSEEGPSIPHVRHADANEHDTA